MIRVHTGRGWRYNPHLLAELRAGVGRGVPHPPIMDVLGVEVDGIDLFAGLSAGLSEDRIVEVTADLAAAVSRLASGYRRAQVSCSGGAVELLLERRSPGPRLALSMVRLRRPSAVILRDLELDLAALAGATLQSGRALLEDLRRIHPRLAEGAPAERLRRALGGALARPPRPLARRVQPEAPEPQRPLIAQSHHAHAPGYRLELEPGNDGALQSFAGGRADLYTLLGHGRLSLDLGPALPSFMASGVPFLLLRDLVAAGLSMVRAMEQGDPEHELALDELVSLNFRFADANGGRAQATFVRDTPHGRQQGLHGFQPCDPAAILTTVFEAALGFGQLAARQNARQSQNQPLVVLVSDAREGLARCRELSPVPTPAEPLDPRKARLLVEPKLGPGRLKLLSYRQAWQRRVTGPVRRLRTVRSLLIVEGEGGVFGLGLASGSRPLGTANQGAGQVRWSLAEEGALVAWPARPAEGTGPVIATGHRLLRLSPAGALQWQTDLSGLAQAVALASEGQSAVAAVASDGEVLCVSADRGVPLWRFAPPGASRLAVHGERGRLLVSTSDGRLYGVSPLKGKLLWRARGKLCDGVPTFRDWLLATGRSPSQLVGVSLSNGELRDFGALELSRLGGITPFGGLLAVAGLRGNAGAVEVLRADGSLAFRWADDERIGGGLPLLLAVPQGLLVRSGRSLSRLGPEGRVEWSHPLSQDSHDGIAPVQRRGVAIAAGDAGLFAFDAETGAVLGQVDDAPATAAVAVDAKLNVYLASEDGPVRALHVQRFLSVL